MQYLDSTARTAADALGHWLCQEAPGEQAHLRIKTGYFTMNGLGALKASMDHLVQNDLPVSIVLGANEKATIKADVDALYTLIGGARPNAKLCVVSCAGGLFHPKVIHLTRTDGSEFAYVGSANLTPAGVNGANIEAGLLLDSREGDPIAILQEIAASIDHWFANPMPGVTSITGPATTQQLVNDGTLGIVKQPPPTGSSNTSGGPGAAQKVPLTPLISFPSLLSSSQGSTGSGGIGTGASQAATAATTPPGGPEILVAQIGKGQRWKQANFPFATMQSFFGVNPTANELIELYPVAANGAQSPPVTAQVVNVRSQNYRVELNAVAGLPYPTNGRPIGVFRKIGTKKFRYRVFFPGDVGYVALNSGLNNIYNGPARELKRIVISSSSLQAIWNGCPV